MTTILLIASLSSLPNANAFGADVQGRNFSVPATQQIEFVPLRKVDQNAFSKLPPSVSLVNIQSSVKSQGSRGACTYFAATGLVESLIKKATGQELDLSEEYLAWAAKTKAKLRVLEEDSSVAVNLLTIQDFGYMLERDLPYQPSWFDEGQPCALTKDRSKAAPICFSHAGPIGDKARLINSGSNLVFEALDSTSLDIASAIAERRVPVHLSILGHTAMWELTRATGNLYLTDEWVKACKSDPKACGGHAVLVVGYDLRSRLFTFKNSWGTEWGRNGYGTIPFDYVDQMSGRKLLTGHVTDGLQFSRATKSNHASSVPTRTTNEKGASRAL